MLAVLRPCLLSESSWLGRRFPLFGLAPWSCVRSLIQWISLNQEPHDGLCQFVKSGLRDHFRRYYSPMVSVVVMSIALLFLPRPLVLTSKDPLFVHVAASVGLLVNMLDDDASPV